MLALRIYPRAFDNTVSKVKNLDKRAPDSASMVDYWDKTDDIVEGRDAVIACGKKYLPKFANEQQKDYDVRLENAKFTNVYRDIVENLSSKPFEEETTLVKNDNVTVPEVFDKFIEDVDGQGNNLTVFAATTFFNGINSCVDWIFIDYPKTTIDPARPRTQAEEKALGIRPFWTHVLGRNVLEVRWQVLGGKIEIVYMRVLEPGMKDNVRVMMRDDLGARWELYERIDTSMSANSDSEWSFIDSGVFTIGVIPMVMFATGRQKGRNYAFYPVMRDAADLQIELYKAESGLNFIKTMGAFPMLAGNGVTPDYEPDKKTVKAIGIGPMRALYAPMDGQGNHGVWALLEPSASSMTFLSADVDKLIAQLRELGRQPLTAQSGNITVITAAVAAGKARSAVAAWGGKLKDSLENAFRITALWLKEEYEPEVRVYDEYDDFSGTDDLTTIDNARKNRDLSQVTYWDELKRRGVLGPDFDAEKEAELLLNELPGDTELLPGDPGYVEPTTPVKKPALPKPTPK